jgi:alkylated DNA nucleotide flippase Atl1
MLLPSDATVAALIAEVPKRKVITTDLLRKVLAERFKVQGTCPVTTRKALQAIAADASKPVAYWRVIKQNGELIDTFPGGVEGQAALLREEGFTIDGSGKKAKVAMFKASLVRLG